MFASAVYGVEQRAHKCRFIRYNMGIIFLRFRLQNSFLTIFHSPTRIVSHVKWERVGMGSQVIMFTNRYNIGIIPEGSKVAGFIFYSFYEFSGTFRLLVCCGLIGTTIPPSMQWFRFQITFSSTMRTHSYIRLPADIVTVGLTVTNPCDFLNSPESWNFLYFSEFDVEILVVFRSSVLKITCKYSDKFWTFARSVSLIWRTTGCRRMMCFAYSLSSPV